ncbi:hypothetical protein PNP85_02000 [Halobacterium salinarum]|uniref:hypothetical protein n=1 Tax=Halobacterium salinarum TaxID=2242 RepID=UPI0025557C92|nr:hypothetical protein [Halobacterium salinarum]MDL0121111.1 hypothetical protein [Halobacterium salinarum]MDL0135792.1 hypothetical protein [Halobacterium salinarum]MDL0138282.1 hypothetical protein [Halobacterium salinarum]
MVTKSRFRGQYLLTDANIPKKFSNWESESITDEFDFYHSPDLQSSMVNKNGTRILCAGYIFDPLNPQQTNEQVLNKICGDITSGKNIFDVLSIFGGRYILFVDDGNNQLVIPDAGALRSILYGSFNGYSVVTSSTKLALTLFDTTIQTTPSKEKYIEQADYWIGTGTDDDRLSRVLANHFLDLADMSKSRMPHYPPSQKSPVPYSAEILSGSIEALACRFETPHIWLSGGLDSRTILSASKSVSDQCRYIVFDRPDVPEHDIEIPRRLCEKLGLNLTVVEPEPISDSFRYRLNNEFCSPRYSSAISNVEWYDDIEANVVPTTGIISEVARTYYEHPYKPFSPGLCIELSNIPDTDYSRQQLNRWIESAREYERKTNIDIFDLFYWEQKVSTWGARSARELDLVCDLAAPFSNRELLHTLLTTSRDRRRYPYTIYKGIIEECWSACLEEPINHLPNPTIKKSIEKYISEKSNHSLPYHIISNIYKKFRFTGPD